MAITQVTGSMVATNAIAGTIIADNAITAVHIATNAVSSTLIADNAITAVHIAQNVITVTQLADDAVEADKIADGVITTNHLNSAMISSQSAVTANSSDYVLIGDASDSNALKKALVSDFGASLSGSTNNTVVTVTGSSAMQGEANLLYDGTTLEVFGTGTGSYLKLHSNTNAGAMGMAIDATKTSDGELGYVGFFNAGDSVASVRAYRAGANDAGALALGTQTTGGSLTDRMYIDSTGNVGIGTTAPSADTGVARFLQIGSSSDAHSAVVLEDNSGQWEMQNNGDLSFWYDGAGIEKVRITTGGRVGIGTNSPASAVGFGNGGMLHLKGDSSNDVGI